MSGATFETLMALDAKLAPFGVPPFTDWWKREAELFYTHPTARTWAVCVGRGGIKSTVLYKVTLNETLFCDVVVPPGERYWGSISSRLMAEGGKGIGIMSHWLSLLGIRHTPTDGVIELADMPRGIRITAASVGGNTGWRSFFSGADELGKWPTAGALAVDAVEVLTSQQAMSANYANARRMVAGTPLLDGGPFFDLITAGTNDLQVVSGPAATWIANPSITEAHTHRLEPNERVHAREYGARFAQEWEHGFFSGLIERCVGPWAALGYNPMHRYVEGIDPAFYHDLFATCVAHVEGGCIIVDRIDAIVPPRGGAGLSPTECLLRVRAIRDAYRCGSVLTDQFSAATLTDLAARDGMHLLSVPWSASNKAEKFEITRTLMRDGKLRIPNDPALVRELSGIGTRLSSSGHESIQARSGYTDDRVSALVLVVAALAPDLSRSDVPLVVAPPQMLAEGGAIFDSAEVEGTISGSLIPRLSAHHAFAGDPLTDSILNSWAQAPKENT